MKDSFLSLNDRKESFIAVTGAQWASRLPATGRADSVTWTLVRGGLEERVYVRGSRKINYGTVMQVMGRLSAAGFKRVALVTELEQGS